MPLLPTNAPLPAPSWCWLALWGVLSLWAPAVTAQPVPPQPEIATAAQALVTDLAQRGFESVAAYETDGRLVLTLENRRYRYDLDALAAVREAARTQALAPETLTVVFLRQGWPLAAIDLATTAPARPPAAELPTGPPLARAGGPPRWTADLVLRPQIAAAFGNFDDPVAARLSVVPELDLRLWRGFRLKGQLVLDLYDDFRTTDDRLRPGILAARQLWRLPGGLWSSLAIGAFTRNRYGIDWQARKVLGDGRLSLSGQLGYTGFAAYDDGEWLYDDLDIVTWSASLRAAVLPAYGLTAEVAYGRFLGGDHGVHLQVARAFGEVVVAFQGLTTTAGTNAGLRLTIPLPPARQLRPRRVRVRTAETLAWTYWYRGQEPAGSRYDTGFPLDAVWGDLDPLFLPSRLGRAPRE